MKPFNAKASLLIDRATIAQERGNFLARWIRRVLEWLFIG
jgi:hypothetical protein